MISKRSIHPFCSEDISQIENYAAAIASSEKWDCHHRGEILPCGRYSRADLKKFGLYYGRPANELIFLTHDEHARIHSLGNKNSLGYHHTEEWKQANSQRMSGKNHPLYGKHRSEATKEKLRQANLGKRLSDEHREKLRQAGLGEKNHFYGKHHTDATKERLSQVRLGMKFWNNGVKNVLAKTCPDGFGPGRIKRG